MKFLFTTATEDHGMSNLSGYVKLLRHVHVLFPLFCELTIVSSFEASLWTAFCHFASDCIWFILIYFDSFWFYSLTLRLPLILWLPPCFSKSPRHDMPLQSLQNLLNLLRFDRWFERCSWSRWRLYWSPVRNLVSWDRLYMSPAGQPHFESTTEPELGSQPKCSAWAEKVFLGLVIASLATRPMNPAVRCTVLFLGSRDESWVLTGCWSLHFWQFWNDEVVTLKPCVMTGHPCDSMSRETRVQSSSWPRQWPPAQSCSLSWLGFRFSSRQAPGGLRKNLTTDSNS